VPAAFPEPGDLVHLRQRRWLVEATEPPSGHHDSALVHASCVDDDAQGESVSVLWQHELDARVIEDAGWGRVAERGFDDPEVFAAYARTVRWNCVSATDPSLFQSPFRAGIRIDAYQLEPLRKALLLPRVNLLIADDVGLGKTIEAGLIARELLLRRRIDLIVVACPPSMVSQWQDELHTRFGLRFTILDRDYVTRMRRERGFGVNPWSTGSLFLISQRLMVDETYAAGLRDRLGEFRARSLLILDEAHHAAPASGRKYAIDSQITRAVRDLAPRFEHRLFLTATPHNGHPNSFAALMEILDPQRFVRGVAIEPPQLEPVMVRRLKEDLRGLGQNFPERVVDPVVIAGLPADTPELLLARKLAVYRELRQVRLSGESRSRRAQAELAWIGLQQRLLSSVEAFAKTLAVHERSLRRLGEVGRPPAGRRLAREAQRLLAGIDADDDAAGLDGAALDAAEDAAMEAATEAGAIGEGEAWRKHIAAEIAAVAEMRDLAEPHRHRPDAKIDRLVAWIAREVCPGLGTARAAWNERRVLIFTEYEDTRRYIEARLQAAIEGSPLAEERIATFTGTTPTDRREAVKRAFNADPTANPLRILIATDAAREGLNLQRFCHDLFHFDLPWNPSRLEQRNGRIDRKLQSAPQVFCRYFVYADRPEDQVLRRLVEKTEVIRRQLGSAAPVLEDRITTLFAGGIDAARAGEMVREIDAVQAGEREARADGDLEPLREVDAKLARSLEQLRTRLEAARRQVGVDRVQLQRVVNYGLRLAGAQPPAPLGGDAYRFVFDEAMVAGLADAGLRQTIEELRLEEEDGTGHLRPVSFAEPADTDAETIQLHLEHPLVHRLLDRFRNQGLVHHDLSRACLAVSPDAVPRIVLLGRLSLWGGSAARLHEEVVRVAARWTEPAARSSPLRAYGRDAERDTLAALDRALDDPASVRVPEGVQRRLLATAGEDVTTLLAELERRGQEAQAEAVAKLADRGRREAAAMRELLQAQRKRIEREIAREDDPQFRLDLDDPNEQRQRRNDRREWERRLARFAAEVEEEPRRIETSYVVRASRLEPVGIVYLWPASG